MVKTSKEKRSLIKRLTSESSLISRLKFSISNDIGVQRILLALVLIITLIILTSPKFISEVEVKDAGEIAESDIISPVKFPVYKDEESYEKERKELLSKVRPYYYIDDEITEIALSQIHPFFESAVKIIKSKGLNYAISSEGMKLPDETWLLIYNSDKREQLEQNVYTLTERLMNRGILKDKTDLIENNTNKITVEDFNGQERDVKTENIIEINSVEPVLSEEANSLIPEDDDLRNSSILITKMMLKPNLIENKNITNKRIKKALSQINPIKYWILEGEKIVSAHTRITEEQIQIVNALNDNLSIGRIVLIWIGKSFIILVLTTILVIYLYYFHKKIYENIKYLIVISIIFLSGIGIGKLIIHIFSEQLPQSGFLFPAATISILLTLLFNMEIGLISSLFSGLIAGILCGFDITVTLVTMIGSSIGAISASKINHKRVLLYTGFLVISSVIIVIIGTQLISLSPIRDILYQLLWGISGAVLSIVLVSIILPLIEYSFNMSSDMRLMRFSDLNSSLLRKFASRAPGTYHHSIQVSILAEACSDAIDSNSVLCRVAGYYHDIGKMLTPEFFIENQDPSENPHETLTPHFSAMVIKKHVKDGIDIAREYRLPDRILDIIREHHGTSTISYFYRKAVREGQDDFIDQSEYRYPGPKPRSRESAILMVCDSAESAVRSLGNPSKSNIRNTVSSIVENRLEDGQFDDCDITLQEIETIRRTVIIELSNIYHKRIPYQEEEEEQTETGRLMRDANSTTYEIFPKKD